MSGSSPPRTFRLPMSSKRGRKRNDSLPPNRARDVQRAFRARRAAHLLALEQRVSELELENARLRKMVGWPPDDRPPLGKGPTGKDKPKPFDPATLHSVDFFSTRDSVSPAAESSASARTGSLSPAAMAAGLHVIDNDVWENALTMSDTHEPESPYTMASMSAPLPKSVYTPYPQSYASGALNPPSSSRHSLPSSSLHVSSSPGYSHSYAHPHGGDRTLRSSYGSSSFVMRGAEVRGDPPRGPYNYSHSQHGYPDPSMQTDAPPSPSSTPAPSHNLYQQPQLRDPTESMPVANHRHSFTDQYPVTQGIQHISSSTPQLHHQHHHQQQRQPENRVPDNSIQYRAAYTPDGHLGSLS